MKKKKPVKAPVKRVARRNSVLRTTQHAKDVGRAAVLLEQYANSIRAGFVMGDGSFDQRTKEGREAHDEFFDIMALVARLKKSVTEASNRKVSR